MSHSNASTLDRAVIQRCMQASVQVVALKKGFLGGASTVWNGSGTVVHPGGLILTNCHVANPRAMGMPAPPADRLAIAITERSDSPPVLTYFADIIAQAPEMDLAILRIVGTVDGRPVQELDLPYLAVANSDQVELGDSLSIFGYPGIGGDTLTYTQGTVAGFTRQEGVSGRAWIKTDATIAGGNSGGTAVNHAGNLVGIPTQAAAGAGITPVDARPVVDTNRDGMVDMRDTPMAIGGFINGLRPVNLAAAWFKKLGIPIVDADSEAGPAAAPVRKVAPIPAQAQPPAPAPAAPAPRAEAPATPQGPFDLLMFSAEVAADGRPVSPGAFLPSGGAQVCATFQYQGLRNGLPWGQVWTLNGRKVLEKEDRWDDGEAGRKVIRLSNPKGLPDGTYHLILLLGGQVVLEGKVVVGHDEGADCQVSGQIVDGQTGRGLKGVMVAALRPGVAVKQYAESRDRKLIHSLAVTADEGRFTFPEQLPKGQTYGLVVLADGYQDLGIDSALSIGAHVPEQATMNPIPLSRG